MFNKTHTSYCDIFSILHILYMYHLPSWLLVSNIYSVTMPKTTGTGFSLSI